MIDYQPAKIWFHTLVSLKMMMLTWTGKSRLNSRGAASKCSGVGDGQMLIQAMAAGTTEGAVDSWWITYIISGCLTLISKMALVMIDERRVLSKKLVMIESEILIQSWRWVVWASGRSFYHLAQLREQVTRGHNIVANGWAGASDVLLCPHIHGCGPVRDQIGTLWY